MNREDLKQQAASRRSGSAEAPAEARWVCTYCSKAFVFEKAFMDHKCKGKMKIDELRSKVGQAAYAYYSHWMQVQRHSVPSIETFGDSRLYTTFIKFAQWVEKTKLPNVPEFIRMMVENGKVQPSLWCRDNVYAMFLKSYDAAVPPEKQFLDSAQVLSDFAADTHTELTKIFETIGVDTLVSLIQKRKLSHWFLLASDNFKSYLRNLPAQERDRVTMALNIGAAVERIRQEDVLFREFGKGTKELGL